MTTKEIKDIEPKRFPKFEDALKQFSMDDIYKLAEAGYVMGIVEIGGVIDE